MTVKLSRTANEIKPSATMAASAKAKQMIARGMDVISFSIGEPDFDTPGNIKQAGIKAIKDGFTKYTPVAGIPELKEAIRQKLKKDNNLDYTTDEIVVSCGAKHSLFNIMVVLCESGDEVIIPAPYWVTYPDQVTMTGAKAVIIETTAAAGFKVTPERLGTAITPATKAIILNTPCNPTGMAYSEQELRELVGLAVGKGIVVISDEIYEKIIYDGLKHASPASFGPEFREHVITVNGLSKSYAMTGWRMGYAAGPMEIMKAATCIQSQITSGPFAIAQAASVEALTGDQRSVGEMVAEFDRRRKYIVERLNAMPGVTCLMPQGAFYAFPNVSEWFGKTLGGQKIESSFDFTDVLLEKALIAVVPGAAFGADRNVRISYATSLEKIEEGMNRMEKLLAD